MNLLASPVQRKFLFTVLYVSEGAPIGFIWWYLPPLLASAGVPVERYTTLAALLVLPWSFKFLWAPLVDILHGPRFGLRHWIITMQLLMGLTLLPLYFLDFQQDYRILLVLLMAHAFFAATQDVSIDALAIHSSRKSERGALNGWMQMGMLTGRALFGAVALLMVDRFGHVVVPAMVGLIWLSALLVLFFSREHFEPHRGEAVRGHWLAFKHSLWGVLRHRATWLGLGVAVTGGLAYESVGAVAGHFWVHHKVDEEIIGLFFLITVGCMMGGALVGGYLSDRFGRRGSVALLLVVTVLTVWVLAGLDHFLPPGLFLARMPGMLGVYICIGLFTAASYALFMDLTDPRLGATQFSAFMGGTNLCEALAAGSIGLLIAGSGYPAAFFVMGCLSLIALPLIGLLKMPIRG